MRRETVEQKEHREELEKLLGSQQTGFSKALVDQPGAKMIATELDKATYDTIARFKGSNKSHHPHRCPTCLGDRYLRVRYQIINRQGRIVEGVKAESCPDCFNSYGLDREWFEAVKNGEVAA